MKFNFKKIKFSYEVKKKEWVGNGFYVHGLLRPTLELNKYISPFILMDYASPMVFEKSKNTRGVGEHPHRGFETVTFAYQGEIEHRDSSGGGGVIKSGDIQWMTAGKGIVHDEFHSKKFTQIGGIFEMVQLWINLPKKFKMTNPKYQEIQKKNIPSCIIGNETKLRIIAGEYLGTKGPASTYTEVNIYDINSKYGEDIKLKFKVGSNTIILIMKGDILINNKKYQDQYVLIFGREFENIHFKVSKDFKGLILNGDPIDEPIEAYGPFVMNTKQEINEAISDFQNGKMGRL